jgi:hypothetical protein
LHETRGEVAMQNAQLKLQKIQDEMMTMQQKEEK